MLGGLVRWEGAYRLRHSVSQKYLKVGKNSFTQSGVTYFEAELVDMSTAGADSAARTGKPVLFKKVPHRPNSSRAPHCSLPTHAA